MTCCRKQQREIGPHGVRHRCVNSRAEVHLQIVDTDTTCSACPVKIACPGQSQSTPQDPQSAILEGYPTCEYRQQGPVCGITGLKVTPEICNRCDAETRERVANLGDKFVGYAHAIKRWVAAGRPTRSKEEIQKIFDEHCSQCEKYDKENHSCKNCGCSVTTAGNPLTNKLAMKTERCPLGRWQ